MNFSTNTPLLVSHNLGYRYPSSSNMVFQNLTFSINKGDILGIVGESGTGKTTLVKCIMGQLQPTAGTLLFQGKKIIKPSFFKKWSFNEVSEKQMIFQDAYGSLNPAMSIKENLFEPFLIQKQYLSTEHETQIIHWLNRVGLNEEVLFKYPHQLSGGMCQRICIARALSLNPKLLVADEILSSLDIINSNIIIKTLVELSQTKAMGIIFVSHNLNAIYSLCNKVLTLPSGEITA